MARRPQLRRARIFLTSVIAAALTGLVVIPASAVPINSEPATSVAPTVTQFVEGWHIPKAVGNWQQDGGGVNMSAGHWPEFPVHALRLWDTRTAWLNLEPKQDEFDFTVLDQNLEIARGNNVNDVTLVLWGTPDWATDISDAAAANWLGPKSASPPRDVNDWLQYVDVVTARYKGQITAYEIGNETNLRTFWNGTDDQLVNMTAAAAQIIRRNDPDAKIIIPAPVLRSPNISTKVKNFWKAAAKYNISYDALAIHIYPQTTDPNAIIDVVNAANLAAVEAGLPAKPVWVTEFNLPTGYSQEDAKAMVDRARSSLLIERVYWYAYDVTSNDTLLSLK